MRKDNPNLTFEELNQTIKTYIKNEQELKMINKAYQYANKMHYGVKRLTGEDYITHPLNVALILTSIEADAATLCGGLLHDVLEDCDVTKEELTKEFGSEIVALVDGVTKINKLNFSGDNEATTFNHRKILVGLCEDVRVIIIKLADRLHNLRTMWIIPEKKQKAKAKETLDILTPIAGRLGMNKIKSELEDLSLRYYKPEIYFSVVEQLNQTKQERDQNVNEMVSKVSTLLDSQNIIHEIKGRSKSIYSIYKKLDKGRRFSEIYDLLALRVFVNTEAECYQALGVIHSKYRPIPNRFKDFIAMPKTNMYQSLHTTVFGVDGQLYEIQIRTYEMDQIAENGIAAHWSYKEKGSVKANMQNAMEQKLQIFKAIMELKNDEESAEAFVKSVQDDVLKDSVYVFTPKGDVVELPIGSTPIDFAYKVHSDVGNKMVGAIVNGVIVPLDYELQDNDILKINTKPSATPNREWMNIAKTTGARNKIKSFFSKIEKKNSSKEGEEMINRELRKKKLSITDFFSNENVEKMLKELKYNTLEELFVNVGVGKLTPNTVLNIIYAKSKSKQEMILENVQNQTVKAPTVKNDILVDGIDDIKVNIAACCKPVPNDRIIGYITKGYGISVHRMVCPNVSELEERTINVKWNQNITKKYPAGLLIHTEKGNDLLLEIISKTTNSNINIKSINSINASIYELTILVENKENLVKFIHELETINNIISVERRLL